MTWLLNIQVINIHVKQRGENWTVLLSWGAFSLPGNMSPRISKLNSKLLR